MNLLSTIALRRTLAPRNLATTAITTTAQPFLALASLRRPFYQPTQTRLYIFQNFSLTPTNMSGTPGKRGVHNLEA